MKNWKNNCNEKTYPDSKTAFKVLQGIDLCIALPDGIDSILALCSKAGRF